MKIKMMSGLPGSGKSTEARKIVDTGNSGRINRDDLRAMVFNGKWTGKREGVVIEIEKAIANILMKNNIVPVIDDTNLSQSHRDMWNDVAVKSGASLEVIKMTTSLEECINRDIQRNNRVGEAVINRMALRNGLINFGKKKIVIVDCDGTICNGNHRMHHIEGENKNWATYFNLMSLDTPIDLVVRWVRELSLDHTIVILTGRPEDYQFLTINWLRENNVPFDYIFMRGSSDMRSDTLVKGEIIDLLPKEQILMALDDRPSIVQLFRDKGIKVIPVRGCIEEF